MNAIMLLVLFLRISSNSYIECRSNRIRRIVGGIEADVAPYNVPVAYVNYAEKTATVYGQLENSTYYSFKGLRYGQSPTGVHRFQVTLLRY